MSFSWVLETTPGHCWHDRHHPDRDFLPWACWSAYATSTILDDGPDDGERGRCEDGNPFDLLDIEMPFMQAYSRCIWICIMVEHGWTVVNTRMRKCEPRPSPGVSPHPLKVPTFGWVWQCGWRCMPTFAPTRQQLTCSRALWGEWTKGQNNSYSIGLSSRLGQSIFVVAWIHQSINHSLNPSIHQSI